MSFHNKLKDIVSSSSLSTRDNKELIRLIKTNGLPYRDILLEAGMNLYISGVLHDDESSIYI